MMTKKCLSTAVLMLVICCLVAGWASAFYPGQYTDNSQTLALYHLNQSSGTTVADDNSTGRLAHNGVLQGSPTPTWTNGDFGNGLHITSWDVSDANGGLNMGALADNGNCTLEFYFKRDSWSATDGFMGYLFNANGTMWARAYNTGTNGVISLTYGVKGYDDWHEKSVDVNLGVGEWHHLAFTRSATGTSPNFRTDFSIFFDGALVATSGWNGLWALGSSTLNLGIDTPAGGTYDEIRFLNFAKGGCGSQGYEMADLNKDCNVDLQDFAMIGKSWMNCSWSSENQVGCVNCNAPVEDSVDEHTVLLWHMNEGVGATAFDAGPNANDLTINAVGTEYAWDPTSKFGSGLLAPNPNTSGCKSVSAIPVTNVNQMMISAWVKIAGVSPDASYIVEVNGPAFLRVDPGKTSVQAGFRTWANSSSTEPNGVWVEAHADPLGAGKDVTIEGQWHHVAGVFNGLPDANGNANVSLYWDGVCIAKTSIAANTDTMPGHESRVGLTLHDVDVANGNAPYEAKVYIGGTMTSKAFIGYIDEVQISNIARTKIFNTACE